MSDSWGEDCKQPNGPFPRTKSGRNETEEGGDSDENSTQPDLGISNEIQTSRRTNNVDGHVGGSSDAPRREENPFSFKHFLSRETGNGQNTGAKPKVYTSPTYSNPTDLDYSRSSSRNLTSNPDIASALPDFVQDHLVVEQCFLREAASSPLSVDLDNLPDFAINKDASIDSASSCRSRQSKYNNFTRRREQNPNRGMDSIPLDLPNVSNVNAVADMLRNAGLPFDLPLVRDVISSHSSGNGSIPGLVQDIIPNVSGNNNMSGSPAQPAVSKSLPDFLSDGPIRGGHLPPADVTAEASGVAQNHVLEERFQTENERLRAEVDLLRGQNIELTRRVQSLQVKLRSLHEKEHEDTLTMEKVIEQAEDNLQRTTKRAVDAENVVSKLKHDIKQLMSELRLLKKENWELRGGEGASGVSGGVSPTSIPEIPENQAHMQRFAQELKAVASTAESSLRQLLSGVDSLRLLASSMETAHRVEDRTRDYLSDLGDNDDTRPAL